MNKKSRIGWKPQNYESRVASVRIRCLNTLEELRAGNFPVELYNPRHEKEYKAVVFSKAYNPRDVEIAGRLAAQGTRVIFDLCDNHFLLGEHRVERLNSMFAIADQWVVSSQAMAEVVRRRFDAEKPLTVIDDAVEEQLSGAWFDVPGWLKARWQLRGLRRFLNSAEQRRATHLVWFGNHKASYGDSGLAHVGKLRELLTETHAADPITLTIISNSREVFSSVFSDWEIPLYYIDWSAHTFFDALRLHDVAVIPIDVNEFTEVKTNNRIALSLSLGLGVVADAIPSYRVFDSCAFLDNWRDGLARYIHEPGLIQQHSACGRKIIAQRFSRKVIADRWKTLFESL